MHKESLPVLLTPREVASILRVDLSTVLQDDRQGDDRRRPVRGARHTVRIPAADWPPLCRTSHPRGGKRCPPITRPC